MAVGKSQNGEYLPRFNDFGGKLLLKSGQTGPCGASLIEKLQQSEKR